MSNNIYDAIRNALNDAEASVQALLPLSEGGNVTARLLIATARKQIDECRSILEQAEQPAMSPQLRLVVGAE